MEQTTQKESPNKTTEETLTHLESEKCLQNSEPNIKVKKCIVDHKEIVSDNLLAIGDPQIVENLQQIRQISNEPNHGIQKKSIDAKNGNGIINLVNNEIDAETTDDFRSMELITNKPTVYLSNSDPEILHIDPNSNIQRKEKIHSFSDIISNTLLAIYESQPKPKEDKATKETAAEEEIVGAANPTISSDNLSSEPNYKAKINKRSISDELNRNQQMMKNFGPAQQQPAPKSRTFLEKLQSETSDERQDRLSKSLQHMMTAVSVLGQIDKFLITRFKSGVKMAARMYDNEDDQIRSRRNSFL